MTAVRLWVLPIDAARRLRVEPLLEDAERERSTRFRRSDDVARFVASRVLLRFAAAELLRCEPRSVRLTRHCPVCHSNEHGRPVVAGATGGPYLSLTHGGDVIAVAAAEEPVGIDVEPYAERHDLEAVMREMLTATERAIVEASERTHGCDRFHDLWTLKEAFFQAGGLTLDDMRHVDVSAALAGPAWIQHGASRFLCQRLELASGHAGALAAYDTGVVRRDAAGAIAGLAP
jgi:phosphopantetheinyl transferase